MMNTSINCNCERISLIKRAAFKKGVLLYGNTSCEKALQETNRLIYEEINFHLMCIEDKEKLKMAKCIFCSDSYYNAARLKLDPSGYENRVRGFSCAAPPPESDAVEPLGRSFGSILNFSDRME